MKTQDKKQAHISRVAAEQAVHVIASVEPSLDLAIERFANECPGELLTLPARQTILNELCDYIENLAKADGKVCKSEISTYDDLLLAFDYSGKAFVRRIVLVNAESDKFSLAEDGMAESFRTRSVVADLLGKLDKVEGTHFEKCYVDGVSALLLYFASADGGISPAEMKLL